MNSQSNILAEVKQINSESAIKKKKISFISAIFIVIGSCIGSGIFFKAGSVLQNSWSSFPIAITSWILSAIGVICMSLSLIEVTSKKASNLSMIGWVKNFSTRFMYKACKNFMFYVYMPLTLFFMPLYVVQGFQDALVSFGVQHHFNTAHDWAIWAIIGLAISFWFILTSGLSSKFGNMQNWVITCVKFFPLAIITFLGIYIASVTENSSVIITPIKPENNMLRFESMWPGIGMFISFAAIFFAYDGFYYSVGIQTDMKQPEKTSKALVIGLSVVTAIYLLIATSMTIAFPQDGGFGSFTGFLEKRNLGWVAGVTNLMISIGILGIINSFSMWSTRFTEDLISEYELPFSHKYINKTNVNKPMIGVIYVSIITTILYTLFATIGGLAYLPVYSDSNGSFYDGEGFSSMSRLLGFADLMANWTSTFAFGFIVIAIIGCMKKRNTDPEIVKTKTFMPAAIITIIIVSAGLVFQSIAPFINVILIYHPQVHNDSNEVIARVMILVVLLLFVALSIFPSMVDYDSKWGKKKYNIDLIVKENEIKEIESEN